MAPTNYRRISLITAAAKVYAYLLLQRMLPSLQGKLMDTLHAFLPGRGTGGSQFVLRRLVELATAARVPFYVVFVDFQRAFDSVDRDVLWAALLAYGVDPHLVDMVKVLYNDSGARVRANGCMSDRFPVTTGVRQGCPLSPLLFNVFVDCVLRDLQREYAARGIRGVSFDYQLPGQPVRSRELPHQAYADDVSGLLVGKRDADAAVAALAAVAARWGLSVNWDKTVAMQVQPTTVEGAVAPPTQVGSPPGPVCGCVPETRYMGQLFRSDGDMQAEVRRRISAASFAFHGLKNVLLDRRGRSLRTRGNIYKTFVLPRLLFGAPETWALTGAQLGGLSAVHNSLLRRMAGVRLGPGLAMPNAVLHTVTGVPALPRHLAHLRLRRLGHMARMPDGSVVKQLLFAKGFTGLPARGGSGAPRRQWFACAKDTLQDHAVGEGWYQLAQDRVFWRRMCRDLTST